MIRYKLRINNLKQLILLVVAIFATATLTMACKSQKDEKRVGIENNEKRVVKELAPYEESDREEHENVASDVAPDSYEIPAPLTDRPEQIISHRGFTLSYNREHNNPNWSAWNLTAEHVSGDIPRGRKFWADESVPKPYRVEYYEYKGSGYDRGHMCPAGDNKWSREAMHDCFYMTNMCPQDPQLNGESWRLLEEACRRWAMTERSLYIVGGPVYRGNSHEKIGTEHNIEVPEAFFKAVLSLRPGHEKAIAFLYENTSQDQSMSSTAMSVDEIEEIVGMDLFHNLEDDLESKIESQYSFSEWR